MAKIRNCFPEPRVVPWLGDRTVGVDEVVDVPDAQCPSFAAAGWAVVEEPRTDPHEQQPVARRGARTAKED